VIPKLILTGDYKEIISTFNPKRNDYEIKSANKSFTVEAA